jgi:tetratricopeptide (TPR) repeat protein
MDLSREERKAALHKLHLDSERFWAQTDAKTSVVAELIDQFLKFTDSTLSEGDRLASFAGQVSNHLGWTGYCQVNEYIIANNPDLAYFTYAMWITCGRAFIMNDESLSLEDRIRVATEIEAIIERAAKETDYAPEQSLAWFYYEHPLKAEQPQLYLLKSKEWFERFIETDDFNECDHHDLQMLGHVYFELGDFKTALHWYKKFEATEHRCHQTCVLDHKLSEKRLVECQQRMLRVDEG